MVRQVRDILYEAQELLLDFDLVTESEFSNGGSPRARNTAFEINALLNKLPLSILTAEIPND